MAWEIYGAKKERWNFLRTLGVGRILEVRICMSRKFRSAEFNEFARLKMCEEGRWDLRRMEIYKIAKRINLWRKMRNRMERKARKFHTFLNYRKN